MNEGRATRIRDMSLQDIAEVEAIDHRSFPLPWPAGAFRFELTQNEHALCWVAETEGRVSGALVGYLVIDEFQVATIAVHPDFRRRGIGRMLLGYAISAAHNAGAQTAFLEVRAGNLPAQSLYRQFGFRIVGNRPRFYADGEDAYIMSVDLLKPEPENC